MQEQTVYLLIYRPSLYDEPSIIGVFSTRDLATAQVDGHGYEVAEVPLDARRDAAEGLPFEDVPWEPATPPVPLTRPEGVAGVFFDAATAFDALRPLRAPQPDQRMVFDGSGIPAKRAAANLRAALAPTEEEHG